MSISIDMVPRVEIDRHWNQVYSKPQYFDPDYVVRAYRKLGLEVMPEPLDTRLIEKIVRALKDKTPFSVIRIGEGEAKILSWMAYTGMLNLERYTITMQMYRRQQDNFRITDTWLSAMRDMMLGSILEADIIGCRSLTNTIRNFHSAQYFKERTQGNLRRSVGVFRAVDYVLYLASRGYFRGKSLGSAYLYFGILENLETMFEYATKIICITSETQVVENMRGKYSDKEFLHIEVGKRSLGGINRSEPSFLVEVESHLQDDLKGVLCLIGGGVWAEFYCSWIKRRGGIAIDVGSGFDILAGRITRPAHKDFLTQRFFRRI